MVCLRFISFRKCFVILLSCFPFTVSSNIPPCLKKFDLSGLACVFELLGLIFQESEFFSNTVVSTITFLKRWKHNNLLYSYLRKHPYTGYPKHVGSKKPKRIFIFYGGILFVGESLHRLYFLPRVDVPP